MFKTNYLNFLDNAKRSFYRSLDGIFGRVGRIASKEIIGQLVKSKYIQLYFTRNW